jgi:hypothetical protein
MKRPHKLLIAATLCVLCLAVGPPLLAQSITTGEIFGRITDDRGTPLADALVMLKAPDLPPG